MSGEQERDTRRPTVSYCITCKGRLAHLQRTLPANLEAERDNPDVEFVVLDYDCPEGTGDWIAATFGGQIASGRLRYARYAPAPHYRVGHAKNMAHRLATGEILCNLDADNFIVRNFSAWLRTAVRAHPGAVFSNNPPTIVRRLTVKWERLRHGRLHAMNGMAGRIALPRDVFQALGGYDEHYVSWGGDEEDLLRRAISAGRDCVFMPREVWGDVISHDAEARMVNLSADGRADALRRLDRKPGLVGSARRFVAHVRHLTRRVPPLVHGGAVGCGQVTVNFGSVLTIAPFGRTA